MKPTFATRSDWTRCARSLLVILLAFAFTRLGLHPAHGAELWIGGATTSITPDEPVALSGQMHTRIAREVESPATATALALESRSGETAGEQAILISCDLVAIREGILEEVRRRVGMRLEDFDTRKLLLGATHTHTAPVTAPGKYEIPGEGVVQPAEYVEFLADRLAEAAADAWESREPGRVGWGLGHAVVGQNRRAVYADGTAKMYGRTDDPNFRHLEGYEDHGIDVLFFWDRKGKLKATAITVACPAQEVEGRSAVNADFWHEVRGLLQARHGEDLLVLGWTAAAGDQSPHLMFRRRAEERMRRLRGFTRLQELAHRIVRGWQEAYEGARQDVRSEITLEHLVRQIELPVREISDQEYDSARKQVAALSENPRNRRRMLWHQDVVDRYERQQAGNVAPYEMELHALRIGDVALVTNDFELFTDFGIQIIARSPALQTFVIQLAGPGTYVPTRRAAKGGGYSAIAESNVVGPEGGLVLVERTLEALNSLWDERPE